MKNYSGINTRYFAQKENLKQLEHEYINYATGLDNCVPARIAKANEIKRKIKRLRALMNKTLNS